MYIHCTNYKCKTFVLNQGAVTNLFCWGGAVFAFCVVVDGIGAS